MSARRFKVGIVGLQPGRSWAARAHVPALRALADRFEIAGVANTSRASAAAAAAAMGIPRAYDDVTALCADPEIDIVTVTVKVPHHFALVMAAITAGKHVYCEWPLGNGLAEAEEMARLAEARGVLGVVGTQARAAPEIEYARQLISEGYVGEVLSSTLVAYGRGWGGTIDSQKIGGYLLDANNGATMLTIPLGHTLAAVRDVLGDMDVRGAVLETRRKTARALDTGEMLPMTAHDQVIVSGVIAAGGRAGGAPISIHYRGGQPRDGNGLLWEINGTAGDLRITGPSGHTQMVPLALEGARGEEKAFKNLTVPESYRAGWPEDVIPGNVARVYARMAADLRDGTQTAPSFADAVAVHRIIDAIQRAARSKASAVVK